LRDQQDNSARHESVQDAEQVDMLGGRLFVGCADGAHDGFSFARALGLGRSGPLHAHHMIALRPFSDGVAEPCRGSSTKDRVQNSHFVKTKRPSNHAKTFLQSKMSTFWT